MTAQAAHIARAQNEVRSGVYYNEIDPYCAAWLQNLMDAGLIPRGDIDTRSIEDVIPNELRGYTQCHFFAGLGGWAYAMQLAGWGTRPVWTGSCPCQPFSAAGKGAGFADERHLWAAWQHLIAQRRPAVIFGEQVAAAVGHAWLDGVCADLEGQGYAIGAAVLPACAAGAPHRRDRLWFGARLVDHANDARLEGLAGHGDHASGWPLASGSAAATCRGSVVADAYRIGGQVDTHAGGIANGGRARQVAGPVCAGNGTLAHSDQLGASEKREQRGWEQRGPCRDPWARHGWIIGHDGKARRTPEPESGIRLLAHGVSARVGKLRAAGNAIVPQVAAAFIESYCEAQGLIALEAAA